MVVFILLLPPLIVLLIFVLALLPLISTNLINFFMKSLTTNWNFFNSEMSLMSWVASAFNALIVFEIYSYLSVKWVRCGWFIFKSFSCFFILASRLSWCFWRRLPKPTSSLSMSLKVLRPCRSVNYYDRSSIVLLIIMVHIRKQIQKIIKSEYLITITFTYP